MSQDVFELMQKMDLHCVETQMALQCAPVFTQLKAANLLIISQEDICKVRQILKCSDISWYILSEWNGKATILLYRKEELLVYLMQEEVCRKLQKMGYTMRSLDEMLCLFGARYQAYQSEGKVFPHEMGFFLGYPKEDVEGFIANEGKNFLYAGYWKVYADLKTKVSLFEKFEAAKEMMIQFVSGGGRVEELCN